MGKILFKKQIFNFEKECEDEFGDYKWYFKIYWCFSKKGITYQISTPDYTINHKKLKNCIIDMLDMMEQGDNLPRYYRLKNAIYSKSLHHKLW